MVENQTLIGNGSKTSLIKNTLKRTPLYALYEVYKSEQISREWLKAGKPVPTPSCVKQRIIKDYAERFDLPIFVETGTYLGEMVDAVKDMFDEIYSIELGQDLYQRACKRFAKANHIRILQGDSGEVLKDVLSQVKRPCLFWLDGHYSADITAKGDLETPIQKELFHISQHSMRSSDVILIDDARLFTGSNDYPDVCSLEDWAESNGFDRFRIEDDIIRIHRSLEKRPQFL